MNKYMIFTVCTENYKDAFDFAIQSWLDKTTAEKIVIYSDAKWGHSDPRIEIKPVFSKSANWGKNVCRKALASIMSLEEGYENVAFVDMDCYLRGDLENVFDKCFDLAVTKLERKGNVSTGVYFMRNTSEMMFFLKKWHKEVKALTEFSDRESQQLPDQKTFSKVIEYDKDVNIKIINLDFRKYNRKISDTKRTDEQKKELLKDDSIVLHFYNKSFLSKRNVKEVFGVLSK